MNVSIAVKRDSGYLRLASDLRFEAKRAASGDVVDEVKGNLTGKAYGSHHEERLKTDAAYREAYATALIETADAAQARGELGEPEVGDEPPGSKGVLTTILDPKTGEPISVRRALDDTPLNRARYSNSEPITDIQWLAGTMYAADSAGGVEYIGNAAIIAANGAFRMQSLDGQRASYGTTTLREDDGLRRVVDGGHVSIPSNVVGETDSNVRRFAKVTRGLTPHERTLARLWLINHAEASHLGSFKALLDKLVNLYATHDAHFEFDAWRYNSAVDVEPANDNVDSGPRRRKRLVV